MTDSKQSALGRVDFAVTDYLQGLETWAVLASRSHSEIRDVMATAELFASAVLVPVCGNAVQKRGSLGFDPDGFMRQKGVFRFEPFADVEGATIVGWLPEQHGSAVAITAACQGHTATGHFEPGSLFTLALDVRLAADKEQLLEIALSSSFQPSTITAGSTDTRHLGCILLRVLFR